MQAKCGAPNKNVYAGCITMANKMWICYQDINRVCQLTSSIFLPEDVEERCSVDTRIWGNLDKRLSLSNCIEHSSSACPSWYRELRCFRAQTCSWNWSCTWLGGDESMSYFSRWWSEKGSLTHHHRQDMFVDFSSDGFAQSKKSWRMPWVLTAPSAHLAGQEQPDWTIAQLHQLLYTLR